MLYGCLWQTVPCPMLDLQSVQEYVWRLSHLLPPSQKEHWKLNFHLCYRAPVKALTAWHSLSLSSDAAM